MDVPSEIRSGDRNAGDVQRPACVVRKSGKDEADTSPAARRGFGPDPPALGLDESPGDGQAQPRAMVHPESAR